MSPGPPQGPHFLPAPPTLSCHAARPFDRPPWRLWLVLVNTPPPTPAAAPSGGVHTAVCAPSWALGSKATGGWQAARSLVTRRDRQSLGSGSACLVWIRGAWCEARGGRGAARLCPAADRSSLAGRTGGSASRVDPSHERQALVKASGTRHKWHWPPVRPATWLDVPSPSRFGGKPRATAGDLGPLAAFRPPSQSRRSGDSAEKAPTSPDAAGGGYGPGRHEAAARTPPLRDLMGGSPVTVGIMDLSVPAACHCRAAAGHRAGDGPAPRGSSDVLSETRRTPGGQARPAGPGFSSAGGRRGQGTRITTHRQQALPRGRTSFWAQRPWHVPGHCSLCSKVVSCVPLVD